MERGTTFDQETPTDNPDKDSSKEGKPASAIQATLKIWLAITLCLACYIISLYGMVTMSTQYFTKRIAQDTYHFDYTNKDDVRCDNATDDRADLIDKVQKDVAAFQLKIAVTTGVPGIVVSLIVGSYSDFVGRKPLLLISNLGGFLKVLVLCLIVALELNLNYFYIGAFIDGAVGSYFTTITAVTSIIADITVPSERAVKFAIIEGTLVVCVAISQAVIGLLISKIGYLAPSVFIAALFVLVFVLVIFLCPETSTGNRRLVDKNPLVHLKRVFGFYVYSDPSQKRHLYLLGIVTFFIGCCANAGRGSVEVLFETSYPLCWGSLEVGFFTAIRLVIMAAAAVIFLRLMKNRLSLEVTGVICVVSAVGGFVFEAFARTSSFMFIAALVGVLHLAVLPLPRALLSQLAAPSEQGALFSSLSTTDVIATTLSTTVFTIIYNSTLDSFKGTLFLVVAGVCSLSIVFFLLFRYHRRALSLPIGSVSVESLPKQTTPKLSESAPLIKDK